MSSPRVTLVRELTRDEDLETIREAFESTCHSWMLEMRAPKTAWGFLWDEILEFSNAVVAQATELPKESDYVQVRAEIENADVGGWVSGGFYVRDASPGDVGVLYQLWVPYPKVAALKLSGEYTAEQLRTMADELEAEQ